MLVRGGAGNIPILHARTRAGLEFLDLHTPSLLSCRFRRTRSAGFGAEITCTLLSVDYYRKLPNYEERKFGFSAAVANPLTTAHFVCLTFWKLQSCLKRKSHVMSTNNISVLVSSHTIVGYVGTVDLFINANILHSSMRV